MRRVVWTPEARRDLNRLGRFLAELSPAAAQRAVALARVRAGQLAAHPRIGERVPGFEPREVRRLLAGSYEMRYELTPKDCAILRIFHAREGR
ncbi:MAG: type II toxin-antitoxin system RelE/ParE family toxin [Gammaproteobacteria bacterium]